MPNFIKIPNQKLSGGKRIPIPQAQKPGVYRVKTTPVKEILLIIKGINFRDYYKHDIKSFSNFMDFIFIYVENTPSLRGRFREYKNR